jgi:hypothetical protein
MRGAAGAALKRAVLGAVVWLVVIAVVIAGIRALEDDDAGGDWANVPVAEGGEVVGHVRNAEGEPITAIIGVTPVDAPLRSGRLTSAHGGSYRLSTFGRPGRYRIVAEIRTCDLSGRTVEVRRQVRIVLNFTLDEC